MHYLSYKLSFIYALLLPISVYLKQIVGGTQVDVTMIWVLAYYLAGFLAALWVLFLFNKNKAKIVRILLTVAVITYLVFGPLPTSNITFPAEIEAALVFTTVFFGMIVSYWIALFINKIVGK